MADSSGLCNGFKLRGLNADADRLAVQSTHETTWLLGRSARFRLGPKWHEVGLLQHELKVLRPYSAAPVIEIKALGGPYGVLIVERSRGETRVLRNGSSLRLELGRDESVVLKTEYWQAPRMDAAPVGRV